MQISVPLNLKLKNLGKYNVLSLMLIGPMQIFNLRSACYRIQISLEDHTASFKMSTGSFLGVKSAST